MINDCYIWCPPLSFSPTSPKDQGEHTIEKCPQYSAEMWISKKKRKLRDEHSHFKVWCAICIAKLAGNNPENITWVTNK